MNAHQTKADCECFACQCSAVLTDEYPDSKHVQFIMQTLPGTIINACNLAPHNAEEQFKSPRFMYAFILGYAVAMENCGVPAYITKEPEGVRSVIKKALKIITIGAIASGKATFPNQKPN